MYKRNVDVICLIAKSNAKSSAFCCHTAILPSQGVGKRASYCFCLLISLYVAIESITTRTTCTFREVQIGSSTIKPIQKQLNYLKPSDFYWKVIFYIYWYNEGFRKYFKLKSNITFFRWFSGNSKFQIILIFKNWTIINKSSFHSEHIGMGLRRIQGNEKYFSNATYSVSFTHIHIFLLLALSLFLVYLSCAIATSEQPFNSLLTKFITRIAIDPRKC